ncbi:ABC-ATPase domain-containing protein [Aquisalimonas sp.]|uniref:ABC-ATPase domain-containing protein n=1 Tax=unclassified Aquisalimonas TaxID=2644645 RepID=UPI0025BABF61|nr:ABC-ATPase domain-containing protein [Aquisalimonas sp.]
MKRLQSILLSIDGKGYKAYRQLTGEYAFDDFQLRVDHVQGDPFASPSRLRVIMPWEQAMLPDDAREPQPRAVAVRDWLGRVFREAAGDSPEIRIDAGRQTVLDRTAVLFTDAGIEIRFTVSLPANGRTILGKTARDLLCRTLPRIVRRTLLPGQRDDDAMRRHADVVEDQAALREALEARGLVAFVADDAVLPRRSGVDDRPLESAVAFRTPDSLRVELPAPNAGPVTGLGIPRGITLVVGGGFHGKSTLLSAVQFGVYDHVPGDGRHQVVADPEAVKLRAEDGRAVQAMDLSPFINALPYGKSTIAFSTELASGSTSQAAALQEALEMGSRTLLVDEDTSATNFMIRDARMQALVAKDDEPITPFVDRIAELRDRLGVSTVLVMGGSGDYFGAADTVIQMHDYQPRDVTAEARRIAEANPSERRIEAPAPLQAPSPRCLDVRSVEPAGKRGKRRVKVRGTDALEFGDDVVDLRALEQLVDASQARAIGLLLPAAGTAADSWLDDAPRWFREWLTQPWETLTRRPDGDLVRPRLTELMAVLNRLRSARFRPASNNPSDHSVAHNK